jgi:hypothetical protein
MMHISVMLPHQDHQTFKFGTWYEFLEIEAKGGNGGNGGQGGIL